MFAVLSSARKAPGRIAILMAALWLSACQPVATTGGGGQPISPSKPIAVALLLPHGSGVPQEQRLARDLENAARMAASDMSGVQIDLRVYGTAGQAEQARTAALNAVQDGARIIIGPLHAESANAVAVAVADRDINVLTFSNNATIAGGNLFVLGQTFENTANRLVSYAARSGKSRILTVYSDNLAGRLGRQAIEQAATRHGATLAGSVSYTFSQDGVVSAVPQIRETARQNDADALFLTANTAGALPLFSQMLPEAGLSTDSIQYMGLSRWDTPPQTMELPGVQGGWFALPDPQRSAQFKSRFQAAYGNAPHELAGLSYDGIAAVGALAKSGDRNALSRGSLTQSAGFQGVNGVFRFRPDGTNERGLAVATIRDQQVEVIDPAPRGFGGAGF
ncbi:MAG: penicillin-binding protein activator [Pseudomonadota bacterium]|uniref:penicillin-binding protein activator n=1 Tax=Roseovarius TaxID=74030 RepID=UPI0022A8B9F7|nr:penicillin-binding protein activator [Roseovarius sp. EGI FJ00037]MCZ0813625.1 penicillin-binding protein activator [Roseovarius sp. EGI FJ00037]